VRSTREELIKKGVIKERVEDTIEEERHPVDVVTSQDKSNNATGGTDHADQITADTSKCDL